MAHNNKSRKLAPESDDFDISDLPSDIREHILSFMSSREAVRTSVLSKPWRHLWKCVPVVRINETVEECNTFLGTFLLGRNHTPINVCDIELTDIETTEMHDVVDKWIFHVVTQCHVRELRVIIRLQGDFLWLKNQALVSKHLKRLEIDKVHLDAKTVDFSSCPSLEELDLMYCTIKAEYIVSKSLKRLIAEECEFSGADTRAHIIFPCLVFLKLNGICSCIPLLEGMPLLQVAYVRLGESCLDLCQYNKTWGCHVDCNFPCTPIDDDKEGSILLEGLSNSTQLELLNEPVMVCLHFPSIPFPTLFIFSCSLLNIMCVPMFPKNKLTKKYFILTLTLEEIGDHYTNMFQ